MVITSRNNPLVRRILSLREKKFRRAAGEYVVEGLKSVREAAESGVHIRLLVRAEHHPLQNIEADSEVVVSPGVFEKLSEEVSPQGILAVVEMPVCTPEPPRSLSLLLDGVSDPGNMGTVLRTANAAGYEDIYLRGCTDPFASKCVRASMGGLFRVRLHIGGDAELASALVGIPLICADMGGENAFCFSPPERFCLVIGNEANGVTEQMHAACAHTIRVPMRPGCESLNAGVSAGILMYLLRADHFRSM